MSVLRDTIREPGSESLCAIGSQCVERKIERLKRLGESGTLLEYTEEDRHRSMNVTRWKFVR